MKSQRTLWVMFVALLCLGAPSGARAQEGKTFVVLDLSTPPVLRNLGRVVSMTVVQEAKKLGATTIDARALARDIGKAKVISAASCGIDAECLGSQLAGVKADRVVAGTFNKTSTHYEVRLVHVDLATRQVVSRFERDILIASRALNAEIKTGLPDLLKGEPSKMGMLRVSSEIPGASIEIDGKLRGHTPELKIPIAPGKHHLIIERKNYLPLDRYVEVAPEGETHFEARLFLIPGREAPTVVATAPDEATTGGMSLGLQVPLATWLSGGAALALAGGGLVYGLKAQRIEKEAVDAAPRDGVLDLTRVRALQGKRSATMANLFYGAAGAGAVAAVVLTAVLGKTADGLDATPGEATPAATVSILPLQDGAFLSLGGRF